MKPQILFSFLFAVLAGCATTGPRYQISIGNEHPSESVRNVKVEGPGLSPQTFQRIAPLKVAALQPRRGSPPPEITVSWTDRAGERHTRTVAQEHPDRFSGQWVIAIGTDNRVASHHVVQDDEGMSILPWNTPESWEGSVGIPGLNER